MNPTMTHHSCLSIGRADGKVLLPMNDRSILKPENEKRSRSVNLLKKPVALALQSVRHRSLSGRQHLP
jgi:hypothetical protein